MNSVLHLIIVLVLDRISYGWFYSEYSYSESSSESEYDLSEESTEESYSDYDSEDDNGQAYLKFKRESNHDQIDTDMIKRFLSEMEAGSHADLFGTNQHYSQPDVYSDLSRRFVPQYPYTEVKHKTKSVEEDRLTPKLAPPEVVLEIAKKSAVLEASKPLEPLDEEIHKKILRTGEYWNDVWIENVNPKNLLRTETKNPKQNLETINVKIMPGSSLYDVVSKLKEKSTRLLYIINSKEKKK